jgi:hypothetical protein
VHTQRSASSEQGARREDLERARRHRQPERAHASRPFTSLSRRRHNSATTSHQSIQKFWCSAAPHKLRRLGLVALGLRVLRAGAAEISPDAPTVRRALGDRPIYGGHAKQQHKLAAIASRQISAISRLRVGTACETGARDSGSAARPPLRVFLSSSGDMANERVTTRNLAIRGGDLRRRKVFPRPRRPAAKARRRRRRRQPAPARAVLHTNELDVTLTFVSLGPSL